MVTVLPVVAAESPQFPAEVHNLVATKVVVSFTQIFTLPMSFTQVAVTDKVAGFATVAGIFDTEVIASVPSAQAAEGRQAIAATIIAILDSLFMFILQVLTYFKI